MAGSAGKLTDSAHLLLISPASRTLGIATHYNNTVLLFLASTKIRIDSFFTAMLLSDDVDEVELDNYYRDKVKGELELHMR